MTTPLRIVYAGTPEFAVPALQALSASEHSVVGVYTQPDRPAGRGRQLRPSAVKQCALQQALPVEQPVTLRDVAAVERLRGYAPDVVVVAAYGLLLPQTVLDIPRYGCINIHASLLPRWRGAAPIQRALLAGDRETGVTIMRMEAGLDTGAMLTTRRLPITARDTAVALHDALSQLGAEALLEVLTDLPAALAHATAQTADGVTYAKKLSKEEARIDWRRPAAEIDRQVRAFNPWPVAQTTLQNVQLRIWDAQCVDHIVAGTPGEILRADGDGIRVATGAGVLNLLQVQLAGRKVVSAAEFARSHSLTGMRLGSDT